MSLKALAKLLLSLLLLSASPTVAQADENRGLAENLHDLKDRARAKAEKLALKAEAAAHAAQLKIKQASKDSGPAIEQAKQRSLRVLQAMVSTPTRRSLFRAMAKCSGLIIGKLLFCGLLHDGLLRAGHFEGKIYKETTTDGKTKVDLANKHYALFTKLGMTSALPETMAAAFVLGMDLLMEKIRPVEASDAKVNKAEILGTAAAESIIETMGDFTGFDWKKGELPKGHFLPGGERRKYSTLSEKNALAFSICVLLNLAKSGTHEKLLNKNSLLMPTLSQIQQVARYIDTSSGTWMDLSSSLGVSKLLGKSLGKAIVGTVGDRIIPNTGKKAKYNRFLTSVLAAWLGAGLAVPVGMATDKLFKDPLFDFKAA